MTLYQYVEEFMCRLCCYKEQNIYTHDFTGVKKISYLDSLCVLKSRVMLFTKNKI